MGDLQKELDDTRHMLVWVLRQLNTRAILELRTHIPGLEDFEEKYMSDDKYAIPLHQCDRCQEWYEKRLAELESKNEVHS